MIIKSKHTNAIAWTLLVTMTSPGFAQTSALHISAARAAALHECNVKAQPFHNESTWGIAWPPRGDRGGTRKVSVFVLIAHQPAVRDDLR